MFDSFEKSKFVVGKEYFTYYMALNSKSNNIGDYSGIIKVKVTSNAPTKYSPEGYTKFDILDINYDLSNMSKNQYDLYLNGYGSAYTFFFENKEECIKHHDEKLISMATTFQIPKNRDRILKKLINKNIVINLEQIEIDCRNWIKNLSKIEKSYLKWILNNLSDKDICT